MRAVTFLLLWTVSCLTVWETSAVLFEVNSQETFPYTVKVEEESELEFNYTITPDDLLERTDFVIEVSVSNQRQAKLVSSPKILVASETASGRFKVLLEGKLPGRPTLLLHYSPLAVHTANSTARDSVTFDLQVERVERPLDVAFTVIVILLVTFANTGLGCNVDLTVVKTQLMKPLAPAIGLFSQFIFMPLIAFTVTRLIKLEPGIALGLFALGCSPGGSASNMYSFLLGGNVSLSITMTLVSTVAAIGFLPLWLFALGDKIVEDSNIEIPYYMIATSLLGIIVPVAVGILAQRKLPRVAKFLTKSIKYVMAVFVVFVFTVGIYANLYVFYLMSVPVLIGAALLPYVGFFLGGLTAFIMRRDWSTIATIAVETGIQNTGIPIVLLRLSLTGPERDTGIVAPIASSIFTPLPLLAWLIYVQGRKWLKERRDGKEKVPQDSEAQDPMNSKPLKQEVLHSDEEGSSVTKL